MNGLQIKRMTLFTWFVVLTALVAVGSPAEAGNRCNICHGTVMPPDIPDNRPLDASERDPN
ncbi:MAG TPA: hypothetical protein VIU40_04105, partial [Geobacteraceae bacterium]